MLNPDIEKALNTQINWEQAASQEYLAMAAWFEQHGLKGFAAYMRKQRDEETEHAMKIYDYVFTRGGRVTLGAIPEPKQSFQSAKSVFEAARAREQSNTKSINELYTLARNVDDYATQTMLHWFIDEQVEEEEWCDEAVALLDMVGDNPGALLMLDKQYGQRAAGGH